MTKPTAERVQKHRQALRAAGLRPVQIWVPDTRRAGFAAECRRQSLRVARSRTKIRFSAGWSRWPIPTAGVDRGFALCAVVTW